MVLPEVFESWVIERIVRRLIRLQKPLSSTTTDGVSSLEKPLTSTTADWVSSLGKLLSHLAAGSPGRLLNRLLNRLRSSTSTKSSGGKGGTRARRVIRLSVGAGMSSYGYKSSLGLGLSLLGLGSSVKLGRGRLATLVKVHCGIGSAEGELAGANILLTTWLSGRLNDIGALSVSLALHGSIRNWGWTGGKLGGSIVRLLWSLNGCLGRWVSDLSLCRCSNRNKIAQCRLRVWAARIAVRVAWWSSRNKSRLTLLLSSMLLMKVPEPILASVNGRKLRWVGKWRWRLGPQRGKEARIGAGSRLVILEILASVGSTRGCSPTRGHETALGALRLSRRGMILLLAVQAREEFIRGCKGHGGLVASTHASSVVAVKATKSKTDLGGRTAATTASCSLVIARVGGAASRFGRGAAATATTATVTTAASTSTSTSISISIHCTTIGNMTARAR